MVGKVPSLKNIPKKVVIFFIEICLKDVYCTI